MRLSHVVPVGFSLPPRHWETNSLWVRAEVRRRSRTETPSHVTRKSLESGSKLIAYIGTGIICCLVLVTLILPGCLLSHPSCCHLRNSKHGTQNLIESETNAQYVKTLGTRRETNFAIGAQTYSLHMSHDLVKLGDYTVTRPYLLSWRCLF